MVTKPLIPTRSEFTDFPSSVSLVFADSLSRIFLEHTQSSLGNRDSIIFLIDAQPRMFRDPTEEGDLPILCAIRCAIDTLCDKIISSENDLAAVCFYGTEQKSNINDVENLITLQELDYADAHRIVRLEEILRIPFYLWDPLL